MLLWSIIGLQFNKKLAECSIHIWSKLQIACTLVHYFSLLPFPKRFKQIHLYSIISVGLFVFGLPNVTVTQHICPQFSHTSFTGLNKRKERLKRVIKASPSDSSLFLCLRVLSWIQLCYYLLQSSFFITCRWIQREAMLGWGG